MFNIFCFQSISTPFFFHNTAKEKIDQQRRWRGQTGGGPALPQLSAAEDALVGSMEGRPVLVGLGCGVDTDGEFPINFVY